MTNEGLGCKKCKVYIDIDSVCGGASGISTFDFVKRHSHKRGLTYLEEHKVWYFRQHGYKEEN